MKCKIKKQIKIAGGLMLFMLINIILCIPKSTAFAEETDYKPKAYSFAVDVSGSMKKTDSEYLAYDMIELFVNSCREEDYFSIVAYNDTIVYDSGLISLQDKDAIAEMLDQFQAVEYTRDTDNGLGLLRATQHLANLDVDEKYVFLITDGDTDLLQGNTDRTLEDSNRDLEKSSSLAVQEGIIIQAIEYTSSYMQDTFKLSLVTSETGGATTLVREPLEFMEVMLNKFYATFGTRKMDFWVAQMNQILQKQQFVLDEKEPSEFYVVLFTREKLSEVEVLDQAGMIPFFQSEHYILAHLTGEESNTVNLLFGLQNDADVIMGTVIYRTPQMITGSKDEPILSQPQKEIVTIVMPKQFPVPCKEPVNYVVLGSLALIIAVTILLCFFIIKKILFQQKEAPRIVGYLSCKFIDLKSKNETKDMHWDLSKEPGAGVTLKELFQSANMKESLQDLDKICFYPSHRKNELILVHCMEGGVFLGDQLIGQNRQVMIRDQDVLYITFADNASELAIQYTYQEGSNEYRG